MPDIAESVETSKLLDELTTRVCREDPYPRYARLREISPVVRADDGALVLTTARGLTRLPILAK